MPDSKVPLLSVRGGSTPLYERLASAIELLIADGDLQTGARLPTHRELARQAGVSIGIVTKAIELLSARGVLRGEVGRGTFVTDAGLSASDSSLVDLTINGPPPVIDPEVFSTAARMAAHSASRMSNSGYADLTGTDRQRVVFSDWLRRTRVNIPASEFLVTVGAQQAIHLAFEDLRQHGPTIVSEAETFPGAIVAAKNLGLGMEAVAHDSEGMLPEALDRKLQESGAKIVYTTPVCQNPLGFEVGEARRRDIANICKKHGAFIVEDDIYAIYSATGAPTYKELAPDLTYYLTSFSKCMTPLLRVGLLSPPTGRRATLARHLRAEVWGASPVSIEIACALLELEADIAVADVLRNEARERVRLTATLLDLKAPPMPGGAPHIWLPMPSLTAERLARRASEENIRLTPPGATSIGTESEGGIRLCIMAPHHRGPLERALSTIARLMNSDESEIV